MAIYQGNITKMQVQADHQGKVQYHLPIDDEKIDVNQLIGTPVKVRFENQINCIHCQRATKKSFNQGYCYPCLISLAQCDACIIKPETCHYHLGTCREPQWGEEHCMSDHFVYLANTGTTKVGITRHVSQGISSRWIDQGATQALAILRVNNRLMSGLVETALKAHIADKTNWRTMLKGEPANVDLLELKHQLLAQVAGELDELKQQHGLQALAEVDSQPVHIDYPVRHYPQKIKSINLDKEMGFEGHLIGIKGQYWMLDGDRVINMRKYAGYRIGIETVASD